MTRVGGHHGNAAQAADRTGHGAGQADDGGARRRPGETADGTWSTVPVRPPTVPVTVVTAPLVPPAACSTSRIAASFSEAFSGSTLAAGTSWGPG